MELSTQWSTVETPQGALPAYRVRPSAAQGRLPAVMVIQEVWGVDDHIRDVAHRLATAGYLTLAPDLLALGGQRPAAVSPERVEAAKQFLNTLPPGGWGDTSARQEALQALPETERERIEQSLAPLFAGPARLEEYAGPLAASVAHLQADPEVRPAGIGSVGFCMGGALSARLACPLLGFYGAEDSRITDGVPALAEAVRARGGSFEHHVYPGTGHAFFNDTRPSFRVDAARDAWARTLGFFNQHLGSAPAR